MRICVLTGKGNRLEVRIDTTKATSPMTTTIRIPSYSKYGTILQTLFSNRT
jgi:hypothetical protein